MSSIEIRTSAHVEAQTKRLCEAVQADQRLAQSRYERLSEAERELHDLTEPVVFPDDRVQEWAFAHGVAQDQLQLQLGDGGLQDLGWCPTLPKRALIRAV